MEQRLAEWMRGRNGADELGNFALGLALVLVIANVFLRTFVMSVLALVLMGYAWWHVAPAR
jgi:hypothetical protein